MAGFILADPSRAKRECCAKERAAGLRAVRCSRRLRLQHGKPVGSGAVDRSRGSGSPGFSANLFTLTSDTFPAQAVGSVVGMGGMAGAIGGMLIATIVGHTLQWTGSYMIPFLMAGSAYVLALAAIQLLVPRLEPADIV